ncbi:hypothetical protein EJ02DRAFT_454949 [Clathrospora elynae]|uniref:Uncharacterized protein n=1 Tax=Clathrospora elynae TaxID=706981 RepID=A0A6A5SPV1_9PLEO|nr:hypothetical protein EJ02DRAFT_454949 [Clathrospora elynae]
MAVRVVLVGQNIVELHSHTVHRQPDCLYIVDPKSTAKTNTVSPGQQRPGNSSLGLASMCLHGEPRFSATSISSRDACFPRILELSTIFSSSLFLLQALFIQEVKQDKANVCAQSRYKSYLFFSQPSSLLSSTHAFEINSVAMSEANGQRIDMTEHSPPPSAELDNHDKKPTSPEAADRASQHDGTEMKTATDVNIPNAPMVEMTSDPQVPISKPATMQAGEVPSATAFQDLFSRPVLTKPGDYSRDQVHPSYMVSYCMVAVLLVSILYWAISVLIASRFINVISTVLVLSALSVVNLHHLLSNVLYFVGRGLGSVITSVRGGIADGRQDTTNKHATEADFHEAMQNAAGQVAAPLTELVTMAKNCAASSQDKSAVEEAANRIEKPLAELMKLATEYVTMQKVRESSISRTETPRHSPCNEGRSRADTLSRLPIVKTPKMSSASPHSPNSGDSTGNSSWRRKKLDISGTDKAKDATERADASERESPSFGANQFLVTKGGVGDMKEASKNHGQVEVKGKTRMGGWSS